MKNFLVIATLACVAAGISLQFKKPEHVVSSSEVAAYSKTFAPTKKVDQAWYCCKGLKWDLQFVDIGNSCTTGTSTCKDASCPEGTWSCDPF